MSPSSVDTIPAQHLIAISSSSRTISQLEFAFHPASQFSLSQTGDAIRNLSPFITLTWVLLFRADFDENFHEIKAELRKEQRMINVLEQNELHFHDGWPQFLF